MTLYNHATALAVRLQETWELSQRVFYRDLAQSAPEEDTRANCRKILQYMAEGLHDFRRNYRVDEKDGNLRIVYSCNVSGMPMVHCVINGDTGDVAKYTTELVSRARHCYNLLDPRSREACLSIADYTGGYLDT